MAAAIVQAPPPPPRRLWQHRDATSTEMWRFLRGVNERRGLDMRTFRDLYDWSVGEKRTEFWEDLWGTSGLVYEGSFEKVVDTSIPMDKVPHWFYGTRLNFAENILYSASPTSPSSRSTLHKEDGKIALTEIREGNTEIRHQTWGAVRARVAHLASSFRAQGVTKGDRVAVVSSTSFDTFICFMAITSLGGLFSSSSTDMGTKGILERLVQIKPKYVFVDDWAVYNGKRTDLRPKIKEIVAGMKRVSEFRGVVVQPRFVGKTSPLEGLEKTVSLEEFLERGDKSEALVFERVAFRDPFLIVYSSGTTGVPKCIVHSVGGVLINVVKEGKLHRELGPDNVVLQYTTTGWIMYLVSIQCLLHGSRSILYDGSPFIPSPTTFLSIVAEQHVTDLGTSPRYLHELEKNSIIPRQLFDLSALRAVLTTGMVLSSSQFEWFYDVAFPPTVHLRNIAGGTDLAGAFGIENPLTPVYVGGCQGPALGTKMEVYDSTILSGPGRAVPDGEAGELVATASFPNQPVFFWGDSTGEKYQNAYYMRFPNVWTHGDFIRVHPTTRQVVFLGRADGVLNPSGVRFGSSDIYTVLESHFPEEVADSVCVGQRRDEDADESVLLFLKMNSGHAFDAALVQRVKAKIGQERSKRHVPRYVFQTWDIPTTVNLKKVELPVKQIVSGSIIKPSGTLANPESLDFYYQFAKVEEVVERLNREKKKEEEVEERGLKSKL
ncbi:acetoacetate-CoA ligase [Pleomassaria siparia CBS 279.74]|uniref:Acetoacetate-CoA ligase n=1 Tax=Pleomassaria siparia CBS 279.74 TaxID=1314801 RepID=A0A6G1JT72_9PLEO|nr:acetoacetate-CoA ligase [Pleomassaria siparia CBS 279.74]